jgi:hypothetical protein
LKSLEWVPSGGKAPRHFVIDPTGHWMLVANQGSDTISSLRVDQEAGRLTPTDRSLVVISPVCIEVAKLYHEASPVFGERLACKTCQPSGRGGNRPVELVIPTDLGQQPRSQHILLSRWELRRCWFRKIWPV